MTIVGQGPERTTIDANLIDRVLDVNNVPDADAVERVPSGLCLWPLRVRLHHRLVSHRALSGHGPETTRVAPRSQ